VFGPATPPLGQGSLEFKIGSNNDWSEAVGYTNLNGVGIGATSLTELSYSTYVQQSSNAASQDFFAILVIDTNGDQLADDFLFFFPANQQGCSDNAPTQHTIAQNQWQQPWDARNGVWVSAFGLCGAENSCGAANDPKTLADYLVCLPNARIINDDGGTPSDPSDDTPGLIIGYGGSTVSANFIGNLDNVKVGESGMTTTFDFDPCVLMCPANITKPNDPNQCGAVVTFSPTTNGGACGTVTCSPASGSFFPKGTTTVTCSTTAGPSCTFTVTVNDNQPPSITCPANVTAVTNQNVCPSPACQVVNYPAPVALDNCPGVGVICNPPAGSCFPAGVTTVTCTATDATGNTATCSFTVTVFDVALQDDSNPSIILLWNSITGQYRFCCNGTTFTGIGKATRQGCVYTLQTPTATDRRILGRHDKAVHAGSGSLQSPPGATRCTITDRNTLNDTNVTSCQ
jgi:hypothetical protein